MKKAPILGLILLLIPGVLFSAPALYEEGTHYVELQIPIRTRTPDKVEVTEFFSYGCPACFLFDSKINEWASGQDDDVVFNRTPATWNRDYLVFAQTYYTAEVMGILDQAHTALFRAIHLQGKAIKRSTGNGQVFFRIWCGTRRFCQGLQFLRYQGKCAAGRSARPGLSICLRAVNHSQWKVSYRRRYGGW